MLDDDKSSSGKLKKENKDLRKKLNDADEEAMSLVGKLAELKQQNADLQHQV